MPVASVDIPGMTADMLETPVSGNTNSTCSSIPPHHMHEKLRTLLRPLVQEFALHSEEIDEILRYIEVRGYRHREQLGCGHDTHIQMENPLRDHQIHLRRLCVLLALGSFALMCTFELSTILLAHNSDNQWRSCSFAIGVLAIAISVFAAEQVQLQRGQRAMQRMAAKQSVESQSMAGHDTLDVCDPDRTSACMQYSGAVAIHGILIGGSTCWLILHASLQNEPQIWVGPATLYTLVSLAIVQYKIMKFKEQIMAHTAITGVACKVPGQSNLPKSKLAYTSETGIISKRCASKWKPLFKDPTFNGQILPACLPLNEAGNKDDEGMVITVTSQSLKHTLMPQDVHTQKSDANSNAGLSKLIDSLPKPANNMAFHREKKESKENSDKDDVELAEMKSLRAEDEKCSSCSGLSDVSAPASEPTD